MYHYAFVDCHYMVIVAPSTLVMTGSSQASGNRAGNEAGGRAGGREKPPGQGASFRSANIGYPGHGRNYGTSAHTSTPYTTNQSNNGQEGEARPTLAKAGAKRTWAWAWTWTWSCTAAQVDITYTTSLGSPLASLQVRSTPRQVFPEFMRSLVSVPKSYV